MLIALLIRENIISVEEIWPYFSKKVKGKDDTLIDVDDVVELYHSEMKDNLNTKYQAIGRSVFDKEKEAREITK